LKKEIENYTVCTPGITILEYVQFAILDLIIQKHQQIEKYVIRKINMGNSYFTLGVGRKL